MKILLVADIECKALWDFYTKEKLEGIDLILSCGDLKAEYLSFLATMTQSPVLYVHGNHDIRYETHGPDGCICIDDRIYNYKGVRIFGLGGSMRYKDGDWQFSQKEMRARVWKKTFSLWCNKGFDILLRSEERRVGKECMRPWAFTTARICPTRVFRCLMT